LASSAAWTEGHALNIDEAVALADASDPAVDGPPVTRPGSSLRNGSARLTAREVEILRLVATGDTNKEIAARLSLTVATVERHLANAYAKIGARGRAEATAFVITSGLYGN
jgi:DNA-binding CsgD family transcriptional regulator